MSQSLMEFEEEFKKLGVTEDDGDYDSDVTPTNSPTAESNFKACPETLVTNYPSSKTSGFWDDSNFGRYSQVSNYSSGSNSSMSWGEDNFEGEATRQVSLLFDQLEDLLYAEQGDHFTSYPVVPLHQGRNAATKVQTRRKESSIPEHIFLRRTSLIENNSQILLSNQMKKLHELGNDNSAFHNAFYPIQSSPTVENNTNSSSNNSDLVDSDSADVVWEPLSKSCEDTIINSKLTQTKQSPSNKIHYIKLSAVAEEIPASDDDSRNGMRNYISKSGPASNFELLDTDQYYSSNVSNDDRFVVGDIESSYKSTNSKVNSANNLVFSSEEADTNHNFSSLRSINLPGGIYAMGFAAPSRKTSSPLLLPTPTSPPGVPKQPTPIMKEECSYWSNRFLHLRIRGYGIDPLKLKVMEAFSFPHEDIPEEQSSEISVYNLKNEDSEGNLLEEVYAIDGTCSPYTSQLCLTGSYLPNLQNSLVGQPKKHTFDNLQDGNSSLYSSIKQPELSSYTISELRQANAISSLQYSRVCSGSGDPAVLKEQVLLLLFDSLWPQVINVVGGLVHRYACHLIASSMQCSSLTREPSGRSNRIGGSALPPGRSSATSAHRHHSSRPSTSNTFQSSASFAHSSWSESPNHLCRISVKEEEEQEVVQIYSLGTGVSRLHTARTLMQLQRAPLSPVSSVANNVVSLPSLDLPAPRPVSSAVPVHNRVSSLTLDLERKSGSPSLGSLLSPSLSPPWGSVSSATTFLPPITSTASPATSSLDISRILSPMSREHHTSASSRLTRRNSDTMARVKVLPSLR